MTQLLRRLALVFLCLPLAPAVYGSQDFPPDVKPIIEQRCMVCHGCYDAPCQLKLDAWAGLERGASKTKVYDGTRLITAELTRLFEDGHSIEDWRNKGFYPVVSQRSPEQGVLARMLALKQEHPLPAGDTLPDSFDLSLDRDQQCPKEEEFDSFAADYPLWGMPYALPGLDEDSHATLVDWVMRGAPAVATPPPSAAETAAIARWETFFNGDSLKHQLMSRYIYEHLFIGSLHFRDIPDSRYYKLVRSRTAPGQPVDIIATRRPYDSPGSERFYYRLQPQRTAVVAKRHMPYALDSKRMARWQALFIDADYTVSKLPSYQTRVASNPFVAFEELPLASRYKFMLDEAHFTIMAYIKGPVCRGQVALNVIDDHFWVAFIDPNVESTQHTAKFLARESGNLRLPSGKSGLLSLVEWRSYSRSQLKFLKAKFEFLRERTTTGDTDVDLDLIWDGDGVNPNAALTVFRHKDSATVVKGFVGRQPKTAWVIDYSLLERIHYLLVAGFDVYGNVGHQLETRLYMDFLRMEGEQNFLFFLPAQDRIALRDFWYRGASEDVKQFVFTDSKAFDRDTDIAYTPDRPAKAQLLDMLRSRLFGADAPGYNDVPGAFSPLRDMTGGGLKLMPEVAFVTVFNNKGRDRVYSLVHTNGFSNNAQLFREEERRLPDEDYVTAANGFIGAYPNVFFQLPEKELPSFVERLSTMTDEEDYANLVSRYGVRRTAPWFWRVSDQLHHYNRKYYQREAGVFDLNRYENR